MVKQLFRGCLILCLVLGTPVFAQGGKEIRCEEILEEQDFQRLLRITHRHVFVSSGVMRVPDRDRLLYEAFREGTIGKVRRDRSTESFLAEREDSLDTVEPEHSQFLAVKLSQELKKRMEQPGYEYELAHSRKGIVHADSDKATALILVQKRGFFPWSKPRAVEVYTVEVPVTTFRGKDLIVVNEIFRPGL